MRKQEKKNFNLINTIKGHIQTNIKEYFIIAIIFLIGIVLGVIIINNVDISGQGKISEYIGNFISSLKGDYQIDQGILLQKSIINNLIYASLLWFIGSTVVGMPLVYLGVGIRGFSLGYSIASAMATLGMSKGILFCLSSMLLQNIIIIPCILAIAVSGMKLHQSILQDKRKENIKIQILKHTIFCGMMAILLVASSFIETYLSGNILTAVIKYL